MTIIQGRNREVRAMVLTHAEAVHADRFRQHGFFNNVAEGLCLGNHGAAGAERDVAERIETEFKYGRHALPEYRGRYFLAGP